MPSTSNVSTGKPKVAGAVFCGPLTATMPTTADATLTGFTELGYVSEDGVTNNNSPETENVKAWGGDTVLVLQTEKADTWTFTLIEALNSEVLKAVYGSSNVTTGTGTISVNATSAMLPDKAYVIDMALKGGAMKRIVIPQGSISELGEIVYKDDEAIGYEITITALPNSSGVTHYEYIKLAASST